MRLLLVIDASLSGALGGKMARCVREADMYTILRIQFLALFRFVAMYTKYHAYPLLSAIPIDISLKFQIHKSHEPFLPEVYSKFHV